MIIYYKNNMEWINLNEFVLYINSCFCLLNVCGVFFLDILLIILYIVWFLLIYNIIL